MAKCGVTNIGGGGGIGSDEVSAAKENVLSGKTYVGTDTGDEIGTGTMENNGATGNQSLNAGNSFLVKKGYHAQDFSVGANSLASQTGGTASAGHILSGQTAWVNGNKVTGSIPYQNAETDGDRVWATAASNWAGTFNIGVRNGHYLNGVNWVRYDVPTFRPENIKKGVNIGGIVGTWEGYIAGSLDLYNRGAWGSISSSNLNAGWHINGDSYKGGTLRYDSAQIALISASSWYSLDMLITKSFNTINYSFFNVTIVSAQPSETQFLRIECGTGYQNTTTSGWSITNRLGYSSNVGFSSSEKTVTLNLTNINSVVYFLLSMYPNTSISSNTDCIYIKKIWFS